MWLPVPREVPKAVICAAPSRPGPQSITPGPGKILNIIFQEKNIMCFIWPETSRKLKNIFHNFGSPQRLRSGIRPEKVGLNYSPRK